MLWDLVTSKLCVVYVELKLEMMSCVRVLQALADRGDGGQDSYDAPAAGGARPKVRDIRAHIGLSVW